MGYLLPSALADGFKKSVIFTLINTQQSNPHLLCKTINQFK